MGVNRERSMINSMMDQSQPGLYARKGRARAQCTLHRSVAACIPHESSSWGVECPKLSDLQRTMELVRRTWIYLRNYSIATGIVPAHEVSKVV